MPAKGGNLSPQIIKKENNRNWESSGFCRNGISNPARIRKIHVIISGMEQHLIPPRFLREKRRPYRAGAFSLPSGVERYEIAGGGALAVRLAGGDALRLVDVEGGQPAEIAVFDSAGKSAAEMLGAAANGRAENLKTMLAKGDAPAAKNLLEKLNISAACAVSILRFGPDGGAGEEADFTAAQDCFAVVAAPGEDMAPDAQNPPTPLLAFITRAAPAENRPPQLPPPLADAAADFCIPRATAQAYTIKKGEWIQLIDVEGRQCTDFQAFSAAALDKGKEYCLDATASRSLNARAYPAPGLHAKYYDYNFQPLVEIVQDTCNRHDAFGLACNAKYYDDMGYPGHVNCSDNFNDALAPFGVEARRGWMAMNFFFNTNIAECGALDADEPWSRPGDYVLLRALTDIVCVSSACPDDIDPANGWNPTDIHVRAYPKNMRARRSVFFRKHPDSEAEMTKETGFHPRTAKLTREFAEYNGYWLPAGYAAGGAINEYWACREKAAAIDLSPLRKFEITGADAETLLQYCLTRDIRRLAEGQVVYAAMCYKTGGMIDDGTLFRLGENNFRWIGGCDYGGEWLRRQAAELGLNARVKTSTDQLHNLSVQGPQSRNILKEIIWTPPHRSALEEIKWFRFTVGRLGGENGEPVVVSRTGYTGEIGYEIFCNPKDAPAVWDAVMKHGAPLGLLPAGLTALDMLRVEAGLIFAGHEFDDQTDPFEAGIGFAVAKTKTEDFIGADSLARRREHPQRTLVGLEIAGEETAAHGDGVYAGRAQAGVITSATRSPVLQKNIALCRMAVEHATIGAEVEIGKLDGHQKRIPAVVVPFPFYDPEKKKPRS